MFFCCVLSGRGLCDELVTRPEESYRLWRVVVCDQETSWYAYVEAIASAGLQSQKKKIIEGDVFHITTSCFYMLYTVLGNKYWS
jgi:hypothetical protein